ncbi:hypothetical protein AB0F15_07590 [Amycolatopsis sp. NPDC026612]|uniref:hypothetical protein n=1 Tax=Amycolatopsis sp. NPDC026612 TaxID=3155466 RepID=UPI003406C261
MDRLQRSLTLVAALVLSSGGLVAATQEAAAATGDAAGAVVSPADPKPPLTASNPGPQTGTAGVPVTPVQLYCYHQNYICDWTITGLPPGLTYTSYGKISGTPTTAGHYTVNGTVKDVIDQRTATTSFSWTINP